MAGAPVLALAAAAGVGTLVGFLVARMRFAGTSNDWAELGAFLLGLFAGAAVAVVGYVAALIVLARRLFAPGRRAAPVLLTLLAHAAVVGVVAGLTSTLQPTSGGGEVAGVLLCLAFAACGPATFVGYGTTGRRRLRAVIVLITLTLSTVLVVSVSHLAR
ncbi:hypothetical protein [Actinoplanes siamensis]|uniref:hypothetical protein n=1 Tax=Actinoplanes siamensis TaxID=1223317 RepID=UPI00194216E0|nr:hypothetical protein [Actinoplanes siamensis]